MKKEKLDVKCTKCGKVRKTYRTDEMPENTHHLEIQYQQMYIYTGLINL